jgi:16S rRNA (cytosine967-C5)-methyltransferase
MELNNQPPKVFARINTLRTSRAELERTWQTEGVSWADVQADWIPQGLAAELTLHPPLAALPSFKGGRFYVQDPSTLLAVDTLDPQPGEQILDLCAAPGGKTTYVAQRMGNRGEIVALDSNPRRLNIVAENCARLGVSCVQGQGSRLADAARFDRVLLDAPCSNTGVMRRRVDLRWRIRPQEIARLQHTQQMLLRDALSHLKAGGTLVYSTCSLEPEENREVIDAFLSEHSDLRLVQQRQLRPTLEGYDGAYVARLVRA